MNGNPRPSAWLVSSILIVTSPAALAAVSADTPKADQAHRLTLQILGGLASCGDRSGGPEYYATASRDDPEVAEELNAVRREQANLRPRIEAFNERIEPLELREHNTVPLTADEQRELDELRARSAVIQQQLRDPTRELTSEERGALTREQSDLGTPWSGWRTSSRCPTTRSATCGISGTNELLWPTVRECWERGSATCWT